MFLILLNYLHFVVPRRTPASPSAAAAASPFSPAAAAASWQLQEKGRKTRLSYHHF